MSSQVVSGFFSGTLRPMLMVVSESGKSFSCVIDTAFNGCLWMTERQAAEIGVSVSQDTRFAVLASDQRLKIILGRLCIRWFGEPRVVYVSVVPDLMMRRSAPSPKEPEILVGTQLLHPDTLVINFLEESVQLIRND
jgi:predicted aspartyl protease